MSASIYGILELLAVISCGFYGILLAVRHEMDVVGVIAVSLIVSFGGGTLRDLVLDRHPLFWVEKEYYTVLVFAMAIGGSLLCRHVGKLEKWLRVPDALGMGLYSILGTQLALDAGTGLFIASVIGVMTGLFGGVMGEIVCNQIPSIFRPAPLSATCSFTGAWVYLLLAPLNLPAGVASSAGVLTVMLFRLSAVRYGWSFPQTSSE
ncbi:MAG: trimeric intracellular cation channel family protein [Verrucomicrobiales bacterium]